MKPKIMLHLEGLIVFLSALYFYHLLGSSWLLFCVLFLAPDLAMLAYIKNTHWGAAIYNVVHNYALAALLAAAGYTLANQVTLDLGLILIAHIGIDRLFGYGLKYPESFKSTHLQKI